MFIFDLSVDSFRTGNKLWSLSPRVLLFIIYLENRVTVPCSESQALPSEKNQKQLKI